VSDSASANQILIGAGKALTITGNVLIGSATDATTTLLTATGAGTLNVINPATGNNFVVGNHQGNQAEADFSGLATLNINVGGTVLVSSTSTTNLTGKGTMTLATTSTITASALTVGGGGSYNGNLNQINSLFLGAGVNTFNVNTINVGTGNRDFGSVTFDGPTGSLVLRAADGVSRAAFNMGTTGGSTGVPTAVGLQNTFDVTGHNADLFLGAVAIGTQATRGDTLNNVFSFDAGTLDMTTLTMSVKTGTPLAGTHIVNSTLNLGGGTVLIGNIAQMGQASTSDNKANATINVTGGNVTIGTGSGTAITMASAGTGTQATGLLNLTGGTTTVTGDIVKTGGAGTTSATVTVNGGLLDMSGKNIGTGASAVVLNAQSGTLQNLNELNGGAVLTKTTGGTLIMQGVNTYTGGTAINAGILQVNSTAALGTAGEISFGGGTLQFTANNTTDYSGRFSTADSQDVSIDTNGQNVTFATNLSSVGGTLAKSGAGTLTLTAANSYTGTTSVNAGTLQVGDGSTGQLSGTGSVMVNGVGTRLSGSGSIAGSTIIGSGAIIAPGVGDTSASNHTLTFTAVSAPLTLVSGSQIQLGITNETFNSVGVADALATASYTDALTYIGANGAEFTSSWNVAPAFTTDMDFINLTNGSISLGTRSGGAGTGTISVANLGYVASAAKGDVFNLIDWQGVMGGTFDAGSGFSSGGIFGDFDLPTLGLGLVWDTSAFTTHGIVVVVPEPSRSLLLLLGLFGLMLRRRRNA
jgi:autotransporter-associated beta strand protein